MSCLLTGENESRKSANTGKLALLWANSADRFGQTVQSDHGIHCLQFHLQLLTKYLLRLAFLFEFWLITAKILESENLGT